MLKPKISQRKSQAAKTKKKIYDVSIKLLKKYGFDRVTIEDICKKANVSVGSFYHYFASKSEIFNEIYKQGDDFFEKEVSTHLGDGSTVDKIQLFFNYYAEFNIENGIDFVRQLYNTQNKLFLKKDRYMPLLLRSIVDDGQKNSEITKAMSSEDITDALFILVRGVIFDWCLHDGDYDLKLAVSNHLARYLLSFEPQQVSD